MPVNEKLKEIPAKPGVYLFQDRQKKVLYVGKAKNLRNRIRSYFQKSRDLDPRIMIMSKKINDFEFIITDSEVEALILEANLIKEHRPRYNVNLKDDKSFPYIRITAEDFPQVFPTRNIIRDGSTYFGPYTNVKEMRDALTTLKRIFALRSCKFDLNKTTIKNKKVPLCLEYYIKKCKGPCQQLQSREEYLEIVIRVKEFLRGKTSSIKDELEKDMLQNSSEQKFEEAARIRDKIEILEKYRNSQKMVMSDLEDRDVFALAHEDDDACAVIFKIREGKVINRVHYYLSSVLHKSSSEILSHFVTQYYTGNDEIPREIYLPEPISEQNLTTQWLTSRAEARISLLVPKVGDKKKLINMCQKNARYLLEELKLQKLKSKDYIPHVLKSLQRDLHLQVAPKRIECFDISNIQGSDPVASMVCFINGRPKKSEYRKYAIRIKSSPDDFAMMREVIKRRYSRQIAENKAFPDLIIVDGGKGQLSSALAVLRELDMNKQPVIGLAKRLEEIFLPGITDPQTLPRTSSSLKLLQQIRDEAHRFAITFHREKRSKRTIKSVLDDVPGIGEKRKQALLKKFGSLKKIKTLNVEILTKDGHLPQRLAQAVYDHLHREDTS
jgi:excinuclease ABC subunit C